MVALSIGKSSYDITIPMEGFPEENGKYVVKEKLEGSGGSASNVSYLLGKWQVDSYFAGTTGYDELATSIKKELESGGVHTNFMEVNYEKKTTMSVIISNKMTTSRTQLMIEPEVFHLKKTEYDIVPDVIYSDGFEYSATLAAFTKYQTSKTVLGASLSDADPKEVEALIKYSNYVVFSLDFACKLCKMKVDVNNPTHLLNLYTEVKAKYPRSINIITLHNGGVLYEYNNEVKVMPTLQVQEVDRTGAGDVFDGTFMYGLGKGYDLEKCMRLSNISAALSTTKYGAKSSIPLLSDVIHKYEEKFGPLEPMNQNTSPDGSTQAPATDVNSAPTPVANREPQNNEGVASQG